jgi:hypothetical protein
MLLHAQDCGSCVVELAAAREFVEGCEDGIDDIVRALCFAPGHGCDDAGCTPFFAGWVCCFDDAIRVGDEQIPGTQLDGRFVIGGVGEDSDGQVTGFEPSKRMV